MNSEAKETNVLKKHKVGVWTVFFMIFCMVAAGAYGIEDMIPTTGPGLTLILLLVIPFLWGVPLGLVASELGSAIPEEGGYYKWIQRGLGNFWGFQAGWWRTLSIYVDSTVYIVFAVAYLDTFFTMSPLTNYLVKAGCIALFTYINIRGVHDVGRFSTIFSLIVFVVFTLIAILGFMKWQYNPFVPFVPQTITWVGIGMSLSIAMWMYSGYESMSTMAGELEDPQVIPKAICLSVPTIVALYFLPTLAGLASVGQWEKWGTEGENCISFASMAGLGGWQGLTYIFVFAAMVSNLALYNTYLASGSRGFFAIAADNLAPKFVTKINRKYGTPHLAILSIAAINLILCQFEFKELVIFDMFLLMLSYVLIYVAAVAIRIKEPGLTRPFRIPVGVKGLIFICAVPVTLALAVITINLVSKICSGESKDMVGVIGIVATVLSGPVAYFIFKKIYGGPSQQGEHTAA
jgi:amino acid transporter